MTAKRIVIIAGPSAVGKTTFARERGRADEPASSCRRYPPHDRPTAEGAMKPLFRPTSLLYDNAANPPALLAEGGLR